MAQALVDMYTKMKTTGSKVVDEQKIMDAYNALPFKEQQKAESMSPELTKDVRTDFGRQERPSAPPAGLGGRSRRHKGRKTSKKGKKGGRRSRKTSKTRR